MLMVGMLDGVHTGFILDIRYLIENHVTTIYFSVNVKNHVKNLGGHPKPKYMFQEEARLSFVEVPGKTISYKEYNNGEHIKVLPCLSPHNLQPLPEPR